MKHLSLSIFAAVLGITFPATSQEPPANLGENLAPPTVPNDVSAEESVELEESQEIEAIRRSNFVLSKIRNNFRAVDPFGMFMDPTNAESSAMLADQYSELEEQPQALKGSSLKTALESLPITGFYPQKQMLVIGARTLQPGGQFGMKLDELTIRLRFEGIKGESLYFRDMDTQEETSIEFNPLPKEFERITGKPRPSRGIVPMNELFIVN
ncbi:MAG: hypothetical protein CMO61_09435 [Verrucomicrobiales bacterium]|nr:hypothetical protein [Verrucomicrobiales bacterium]